MKYEKYIIEPEIRKTEDLPYHKKEAPGVRRVFLEKSLLEEADVYLMVRTVKDVTPEQPEYIEMHAHNVNSAYIFVGGEDNLEGLKAEITIDNEKFIVASPKTVFIPKGKKHFLRLIEGSGHFFHIVLEGDYKRSLTE
jgi:2-isopropylmalate synthase